MADNGKQSGSDLDQAVDILPVQTSPRFSRRAIIVWLVAISLLFFFLTLYLVSLAIRNDIASTENDLKSIKLSIASGATPLPEVQKMLGSLDVTQDQINRLNVIYPTLIAPRQDLPAIIAAIDAYDPNLIAILSLNYSNLQINLGGRAASDDAVMSYANVLERSNLFSRVLIQSIQVMPSPTYGTSLSQITRVPTAQPTSTKQPTAARTPTSTSTAQISAALSTPTSAPTNTPLPPTQTLTPSSTPDLRDAFEPDDAQPKPIALGQAQAHNFQPAGDIDAVTFLAKSSRYYRVSTIELAPGVDTVLNLRAGAIALTNDDIAPGTQASEIAFENTGEDGMAVVTITNRGQYGPDKTYKVLVIELVPTPTSVPKTPTRSAMLNVSNASAAGGGMNPANEKLKSSAADRMPVRFAIVLEPKAVLP